MVWAAIRSAALVFKRSDDHRRILFGAFWAACVGYLVQLMFGLSVTGNTFLLWAALGVVLSPTASTVEFKPPSWGIIVAMVGMVLAGLGIGYQLVYMQADNWYLVAMVGSEGPARVEAAKRAAQLNPFNDMYRAEVGVAYRDVLIGYLNAAQQAQSQGQDPKQYLAQAQDAYNNAVASFEDTIKFVPWEYDNYVFLASIHNIAGQTLSPKYYDDAIAVAERGIAAERYGPAIRVELARANQGKGNLAAAIEQAKIAADMDPAAVDAWTVLGNLYEQSGDKVKALAAYKQAAINNPTVTSFTDAIKRLEASPTTPPK
jgi:tetratricopeptide (TPR) repeat protein